MAQGRKIEVFIAGCPVCAEAVRLVEFLAGTNHDIEIRDMHDAAVAMAARGYGIRSLPAVVIDGRLAGCCSGRGPDETTLTREILGSQGTALYGQNTRQSPAFRRNSSPQSGHFDRQARRRVKRSIVVAALGTAQTLAWGSSYYFAGDPGRSGCAGPRASRTTVFGLSSGALLLSAGLGPAVGRTIDNRGTAACLRYPI